MKTPYLVRLASVALLGLSTIALAACDGHDGAGTATVTVPNATLDVSTDVDLANVKASQAVPMTVDAQNLVLVDPADSPPDDHAADAVYLEFHLDVEPDGLLLATAQTDVAVTIPADTKPGAHKIICRAHQHDDGAPTDVKFVLGISVTAGAHDDGGAKGAPSTAVF